MKLFFLGTGAADYPWHEKLSDAVRGSCSTLIDGTLLIDAGATGLANLARFNVDPAAIEMLLVTHSHSDHFNVDAVQTIAQAPGRKTPLRVAASHQALARLDGSVEKIGLHAGATLQCGEYAVTVLPSNHVLEDPEEESFHFLFETPGKKLLLYALDGAWMCSRAKRLLPEGRPLDMIVWDATCGNHLYNWRFADHNDLEMIRTMRCAMRGAGLINAATIHIFDHTALTMWPAAEAEKQSLASLYGGVIAHDGMSCEL